MTPDLACALIVSGAYFVCDAFGMFNYVIDRIGMFQARTDETRMLKDIRDSHIDRVNDMNLSRRQKNHIQKYTKRLLFILS